MTLNTRIFLAGAVVALGIAGAAMAHTPLCACYDNGDGTILCEGGFSDGASAAGVRLAVIDGDGNVLVEAKMDENSEFTFARPAGVFSVLFDAGEGHEITIPADEIY
ncbi:hypothetical protein [Rhodovulum marinum]|uniref:Nickel transport protein n=1 Tax=Rhodovulum marinum TaxID=320662 RepID=A0A4R2PSM3_9RHOB|nr:hypothetical protein [Rhodovulum marinum]TCP38859.1 hypothetical protein EV662_11613 [Rhodovulum marinum]